MIDTIFRTPEREKVFARNLYADLPVPIYVQKSIGGITDLGPCAASLSESRAMPVAITCVAGVDIQETFASYSSLVDAAAASLIRSFLDEPPANYLLCPESADQSSAGLRAPAPTVSSRRAQGFRKHSGSNRVRGAAGKRVPATNGGAPAGLRFLVPYLRLCAGGNTGSQHCGDRCLGRADGGRCGRARELPGRAAAVAHARRHRSRSGLAEEPGGGVYLSCTPSSSALRCARRAEDRRPQRLRFRVQELADFFRANDLAAIAAGAPRRNEEELRQGATPPALPDTIKTPMSLTATGKVIGVPGVARDITARREAELAVAETQECFRVAFQASPVSASDRARASDGCFVDVNDNYLRDFGWS